MNALQAGVHFPARKGFASGRGGSEYGRHMHSAGAHRPLVARCCAPAQEDSKSSSLKTEEQSSPAPPSPAPPAPRKSSSSSADTTDWIASSLTRRFGLGAGLAWVGFLAFGVISEQIKTRREVYLEEQDTRDVEDAKEVVLGSNIRYKDLRVGGGAAPLDGDLVLIDLVGQVVDGQTFVDTESGSRKRPIALVFGRRPYAGGMCAGLEEVMRSMHVGGKRQVVVPADMGFGAAGVDLGDGAVIPPNATLEYTVTLLKASVAPS
ncbi:hypothetical protein GOP47_0016584 [Adiantum capillus-veneris]|uniref:peptidylprolyl isomerase n=2 Tax=Adiantum capillus-veneris TaxID=13818 RepID=A0A9D4UHZ0_ADICA|nr:hypothetical protein GOP47_0016584 [Adiantum capillus-veneris]